MVVIKSQFKLTGWRGQQMKLRVIEVMTAYGQEIDKQLKEEIKLVQFFWPGTTYRKNGTIERSPRDIVDLGNFLRSQRRTRPKATQIKFTWGGGSVNYAGIILAGRSDTAAYPGRNWILPALKNLPMDDFFAAQWRRLAGQRS